MVNGVITGNGRGGENHWLALGTGAIGHHQGCGTHIGGARGDAVCSGEGVGGCGDGGLRHHSSWSAGTCKTILPVRGIKEATELLSNLNTL